MELYLLTRIVDEIIYDAYVGKLIRAENEAQAREIANSRVGDEGKIWKDPTQTTCEIITSTGNPEVIISDFHAG